MKSGSTPLPVCRNSVLFDNSLNDKRFRIDIRMENGYEEGCTRGARKSPDIGVWAFFLTVRGANFCGGAERLFSLNRKPLAPFTRR